jgi:hypothetical protein
MPDLIGHPHKKTTISQSEKMADNNSKREKESLSIIL